LQALTCECHYGNNVSKFHIYKLIDPKFYFQLIGIKFYMLNTVIISWYSYMPSLVVLVTIHPASRFPYTVLKISFIDTDETSFFIICFRCKCHHNTSAGDIEFSWRNSNDQSSG